MSNKLFTTGLLFCAVALSAAGQRIVVDSTSTNKYLIRPEQKPVAPATSEELSFSDRALSIGMGILNRLKARLNLEEAAESLKDKKEQILGKPEEEQQKDDKSTNET